MHRPRSHDIATLLSPKWLLYNQINPFGATASHAKTVDAALPEARPQAWELHRGQGRLEDQLVDSVSTVSMD